MSISAYFKLKADPRWKGSLAYVPYTLYVAFTASFFALLISWIIVIKGGSPFSIGKIIYQETVPSLSMWYTAITLCTHHYAHAQPPVCLFFEVVLLLAWAVHFSFHTACEVGNDDRNLDVCPAWSGRRYSRLNEIQMSLQYSKVGFAGFAAITFALLVAYSTVAHLRGTKRTIKEEESVHEMGN